MKFVHIFIIASILLSFNSLKADDVKTENKIAKNLRCLICQGQSVYDSDSEFAISLKLVIKNKIQQGMSEEQIYSFLKKNMVNGFFMNQNLIKTPIFFGYYLS